MFRPGIENPWSRRRVAIAKPRAGPCTVGVRGWWWVVVRASGSAGSRGRLTIFAEKLRRESPWLPRCRGLHDGGSNRAKSERGGFARGGSKREAHTACEAAGLLASRAREYSGLSRRQFMRVAVTAGVCQPAGGCQCRSRGKPRWRYTQRTNDTTPDSTYIRSLKDLPGKERHGGKYERAKEKWALRENSQPYPR